MKTLRAFRGRPGQRRTAGHQAAALRGGLVAVRLVAVAAGLAACGGGGSSGGGTGGPLPAPNTGQVQAFPGTQFTVQGEVFAHSTGMVPGAQVNVWIGNERGGYSYWWANGRVDSDGVGNFVLTRLPSGPIQITAFATGYVQPCAVEVIVPHDQTVRVELVSTASLDALDPPRPQLSTEPALTGRVVDAVTGEPLSGVALWAEFVMDTAAATTRTDRSGRYFLCSLRKNTWIHFDRQGYEPQWVGPIDASVSTSLDVQLRALP